MERPRVDSKWEGAAVMVVVMVVVVVVVVDIVPVSDRPDPMSQLQ